MTKPQLYGLGVMLFKKHNAWLAKKAKEHATTKSRILRQCVEYAIGYETYAEQWELEKNTEAKR